MRLSVKVDVYECGAPHRHSVSGVVFRSHPEAPLVVRIDNVDGFATEPSWPLSSLAADALRAEYERQMEA